MPRLRSGLFAILETPIVGRRCWTWLVLVLLLVPASAAATTRPGPRPLNESEVIRLARERSPGAAVAAATEALAQARTKTAGRFPNPFVSWSRETVESGAVGSQDIATAGFPLDFARPLATRSLAASQGAWMRAQARLDRTDAVLDAVVSYYEAVLAKRRVEVIEDSLENLEEAGRVLARREAAGTASGYETARLSVASELTRSELAQARGELKSAKARLGVLLALPPEALQISTSLALISDAQQRSLAQAGGASRDAVALARRSQRLATQASARARWAWVPTVELGVGMKHVSDLGGGFGYVVGVSFDIPIFDRGQALRAEARALESLSAARSQALVRTIDAEVQSAAQSFHAAREELRRFESETAEQVDTLLKAASSGYREGERSILELLDAQRARTDVAKRRLDLLGAAKRAEARLRAAAGDLR